MSIGATNELVVIGQCFNRADWMGIAWLNPGNNTGLSCDDSIVGNLILSCEPNSNYGQHTLSGIQNKFNTKCYFATSPERESISQSLIKTIFQMEFSFNWHCVKILNRWKFEMRFGFRRNSLGRAEQKKSMEYRICVWWCDTMLQAIIVYMPGAHNIRNMQSQRRQKTASASALILNSLITSFTWANSISIENNHNLNVN